MMQQNQIDNTKLSFEATHDALTGLYNRKVFDDMRDKDIDNYTMIYIDIDYFKQVNDTYGHEIGDKGLQKMAYALHKNFVRKTILAVSVAMSLRSSWLMSIPT